MTTWVFLRGLIRESRHWGHFPDIFRRSDPDAEIVLLDLPGNGIRNQQASPSRVEDAAAFCRIELTRLGIAPPYCLLGLSLGGMVAVAWAHRHPQEIAACVLINTSARPYCSFHERLQPRNYLPILKLMSLGGSDEDVERTILGMISFRHEGMSEVFGDWVRYRRERPVRRINLVRQLIAAARFRAPDVPPGAPTLMLASTRDAMVDARCSREMARRWGCPLVEHPGAGHDLPLDDGDWVAVQVREWCARALRPSDGSPS